ncbi:hypothetical protein [Paenibacillus pabuli]|uniref:hypothetical protein n=1 Tax=Paenibacillus pabuli TaxID=1472 RepID=UPI004046B298
MSSNDPINFLCLMKLHNFGIDSFVSIDIVISNFLIEELTKMLNMFMLRKDYEFTINTTEPLFVIHCIRRKPIYNNRSHKLHSIPIIIALQY